MGILEILNACFTIKNPQLFSKNIQENAPTQTRQGSPHNSSKTLTQYRSFFSQTVESTKDLEDVPATASRELTAGDKKEGKSEQNKEHLNRHHNNNDTERIANKGCKDDDKDFVGESENQHNQKNAIAENEGESNSEEEDEDFIERWGAILALPSSSFIQLIQRATSTTSTWQVEKRTEGSFNHAVILTDGTTRLVVKVPIVATEKRWQAPQANIMRSQVDTMTYIKSKLPDYPIPGVFLYDASFDNEIGAPFVIETFMAGKTAYDIWYESNEDGDYDLENADFPSEEREKLRMTFLQSLAKYMAQLRSLEFDQIGMMHFEDGDADKPVIGEYHGWNERQDLETLRIYFKRDVYSTAAAYYAAQFRQKGLPATTAKPRFKALWTIIECIFNSAPFNMSKKHSQDDKETFTFLHDDLALQNILCSDTGEVTGIIDWDKVSTVPRCVGFSSVPMFLREDWEDEYVVAKDFIHSPWNLNKYRKVYADVMAQECGPDSDAKYTHMSHIYGVIHVMLFGDGGEFLYRVDRVVEKLLVEIPELRRVDVDAFMEDLGGEEGWEAAEHVLREGIPKVLDYRNT